jgi:DNA gyrase subunit A
MSTPPGTTTAASALGALAIIDTPVVEEMRTSFLAYAMTVVVSRALPDVRDGLKPVHRRILYGMSELNLLPNRAYVKSANVVGDVMSKFHPHGDSAIYDAMVRMAQDWSMRLPTVDGHGNFGTIVDSPAAMRYTEARMSPAAVAMTRELDEDTVDFIPNYDGRRLQPKVLPAAYPNLLVNGSEGIAVGMATKLAPHNLGEAVAACIHLLAHPDATVDDLIAHLPGPDLPTGGLLLGVDGAHEAYRTGKGVFTMRARAAVTDVSARRKGIVVTELPYQVAAEHVIEAIKRGRDVKKLQGLANVVDLTDRKHGLRLVIECKAGFDPHTVLEELYRLTPLQTNFNVHQLALVHGQPRTLTLLDMVTYYVEHRLTCTRRRSEFRRRKAQERAHLLEGYLIALARIEEVVTLIRASTDTATAKTALMGSFALSDIQASSILEMPLRRLTSLEVEKIEVELRELRQVIADLSALLSDDSAMRALVIAELEQVAREFGTPRRSTIVSGSAPVTAAAGAPVSTPLPDEPCTVTLSTSGLLARFGAGPVTGARGRHDAVLAAVATTTRGQVAVITDTGRLLIVPVLDVPAGDAKSRGGPVGEFADLTPGEEPVGLAAIGATAPMIALATRNGLVKRLAAADLPKKSGQEVIGLKDGDRLLAAVALPEDPDDAEFVFITSDAQLLRTAAAAVRPQGRTGGGMAGVKLTPGAAVIGFAVVPTELAPVTVVVTATDGDGECGVKVSPFAEYPAKGRGTGGVRCHRFARGESSLVAAYTGPTPALVAASGALVKAPTELGRRDGPGVRLPAAVVRIAAAR